MDGRNHWPLLAKCRTDPIYSPVTLTMQNDDDYDGCHNETSFFSFILPLSKNIYPADIIQCACVCVCVCVCVGSYLSLQSIDQREAVFLTAIHFTALLLVNAMSYLV